MADERGTIRTIFRNIFFVIIPAKVFGLLPLRIRGDGLTKEGLFGRMCSIFVLVVAALISITNLLKPIKLLKKFYLQNIFNPILVMTLSSAGNFLVVIIDVYREFTDAQTGLQIIKSLTRYDRKVKQLGLARKDNFLFTWMITLSAILSLLVQLILQSKVLLLFPAIKSIYNYGTMIVKLVDHLARLKFLIIVHLFYQRYKHLNEVVLPKDKWRTRGNTATNRRVVHMHDLVYLHSTLTRATKLLAEAYSFEIFLWASSPIWEFAVTLYHVKYKVRYGIHGFVEEARILVGLLSLCWTCRTTANEANKFAMQILRTDPELIRSVDIDEQLDAAIYMYNNKISFSAWKFYEIDYPMLAFMSLLKYERQCIGSLTSSLSMIVFDDVLLY